MNSKLENRLEELGLWYYFDKDDILIIKVPVKVSSCIKFRCPFCVHKYKSDFTRFKHSRPMSHTYVREQDDDIDSLGTRVALCKTEARMDYNLPPFAFEPVCMSRTVSFK